MCFVPGEKKPLHFLLLIQPAQYRQAININNLYGPLRAHIQKVWLHHIFMNTSEQPCWNNLVDMIIIQKHPPLDSTVTSLYSGHCRDFELVSSLARAHSSESLFQSNVCNIFCGGFSSCPYYWGVFYSRVSTRRELTVLANGTPTLITVSFPPYTVILSVSWSVSQSVR